MKKQYITPATIEEVACVASHILEASIGSDGDLNGITFDDETDGPEMFVKGSMDLWNEE